MKMRVLFLTAFSLLLIAYAPPYTHYAAAQPVYCVPINLYSSSGIRGSYQLNVTFDPSLYKNYLSPDLGNIRFMFSNGTMLHAWLESYSGASPLSSQSALIWVNLPDGVPRGNTVIYMVFEPNQTFDGYWMGEAPQLSPKYGEYDNGMYVFDYYTDFINNRSLDAWDLNGTLPGFAVFQNGMWLNAGLVYGYQFTMNKSYAGNYTVDALEWAANASVNSQNHIGSDNVYPGISFNQLRTSNYTLIPPGNSGGFQEAETYLPTFTEYLSTTNATSNGVNGHPPPQVQTAIPITSPAVFTIGFSGSTVFSQINYSYTISYKNSNTAGPNFPGLTTLALAQTSEDWIHVFWFRVRATPSSALSVSVSRTPTPMVVGLTVTSENGGSVSYSWSGGSGTVQPSQTATIYVPYGTQVKLYADPDSGWAFASWSSSGSGSYSGTNNPITVQVNNPMTETANYNVALTISATGLNSDALGTVVTVNGNSYSYSQLPVTVYIAPGSTVSYSFNSPVSGGSGTQFVWQSTGGIDTTQSGSFTMPDTQAVLTGNYQEQYYLTMEANPSNGGSISPGSGWYNAGTQITISATPNSGYQFYEWVGSGSGSYSGTSNHATIMINAPITEDAIFSVGLTVSVSGMNSNAQDSVVTVNGQQYTYSQLPVTLYIPASSTVSYSFSSPVSGGSDVQFVWQSTSGASSLQSGSFVMLNSPTYLTGNYQEQYYLVMEGNPSNGGSVSPGSGWYDAGSRVTVSASPNSGYAFLSWSGSGSGSYSGTNNPSTITVNSPITEIANFGVSLTISATGLNSNAQGSVVTVNGVSYPYSQLPVTVYIAPGSTVSYSFISPVPGISGQRFVWRSTSGIDTTQSGSFTMPTAPQALTGNYQEQYYLSVVSPNNRGNPQGYGWYNAGTTATFSVMTPVSTGPGQQYVFTSWSGTGSGSYSGTNNPATVTMNGPITETANWQLQYYLTMQVNPQGAGTVSPSSGWYDAGEQITITQSPNSGWEFASWSGSGSGSYSGGTPATSSSSASIVMNGPITETANYYAGLTVSVTGMNSNVQDTVVTIDGVPYSYAQLPVTVYLAPGSSVSYAFNSPISGGSGVQFVWQSTSGIDNAQSGSLTLNSPATLTGNYQEQFYLIMQVNPQGAGTVSPSSGWYNAGAQVTISALANSGYKFISWSGSGSGSYSGSSNTATIVMNSPITETADYNVELTISANGLESDAQGTLVTVDGNPYTYSQLPVTLYIAPGSTVTYNFSSSVSGGSGIRFIWASTSGLATGQSGSFMMPSSPAALIGNYQKQYYLNMSVYPEGSALVSPVSGWYDSGYTVNIASNANPGYEFAFWHGEGNGSYTGPSVKSSVVMDSPITEVSVSYVELSITSTPGGYVYFCYNGTSFKVQNFTTYLPYMARVSLSPASYTGYYFSGWNLSQVNGTFVLLYPSSFKAIFLKYNIINFSAVSSSFSLLNAYGELVDQQGNIIILNSGEQTLVKPGLYFLVMSQDQFNQTPYRYYFGSQNLSTFNQITMVNITGNGKDYRLLAVDPVKTVLSVHVVSLYDREVYLTVSLVNQLTEAPIPYQVVQISLWSEYGNYSASINTGPQGKVSINVPYVHGGTYSWKAYYSGNSSIGTNPCTSSSSLKTSLFSSKVKISENGLPKGTTWTGSIGGYSFASSQGSVVLNVYSGKYSLDINPVFTQQVEYVPSAYPSYINAFGSVYISVNYSAYFYVYITSGNIRGGTVSMHGTHWFSNGSEITISADPNAGYRFSCWVTTGSSIKFSNYSAEETTAIINGPGAIIAEFEPES
ncbi:MAG: InlB B-repeat-containing protein [Nitrososphaeria archaeon]